MDKNVGLVLEGGGFRGCYTAGALNWLYDNGIKINYSVTISAASAYGFFYAGGRIAEMKNIALKGIKDKGVIGLSPLFKEGGIVGYGHLCAKYLEPFYQETLKDIKSSEQDMEIGLYNMDKQELQYFNKDQYDDKGQIIKASCVLPLTGKMTTINGEKYLDGGIRTMVSIERSIATGHQKNIVIVTKDKNYVRKPNGFFLTTLLKLVYHKYKKMLATLDNRVDTYYHEMQMVYDLEKEGKAILIRPSKDCGVGRFSGSEEQLEEMYKLGYQDMEDRKEEIFNFLGIK
ncbi:MAG: patatin family protein [Erysipelotrichia bacterium]|nr:patatin family protein [Erysipelotrichia bacterium]